MMGNLSAWDYSRGKSFSKKNFIRKTLGDFKNVIDLTALKPVESVRGYLIYPWVGAVRPGPLYPDPV